MYYGDPIPINDTILTDSNVAEDDEPLWTSVGTYSPGQRVVRTTTHRVYEAITTNTNKIPEDNPSDWLEVSATQRYQPFDYYISDGAAGDNLYWSLRPPTMIDIIGIFNVRCDSIDVFIEKDSVVLMDENIPMSTIDTAVDFFTWIVAVPEAIPEIAIPVNSLPGADITLTFNGTNVLIGQIGIALTEFWGQTDWDSGFVFRSSSVIKPNEFGKFAVTKRNSAFDWNFVLRMPPERAPFIKKRVQVADGKVGMFFGDKTGRFGSSIMGILNLMKMDPKLGVSTANVSIQGYV